MAVETIINGGFKATITESPIKTVGGETIDAALLHAQAEVSLDRLSQQARMCML
jgi:hypothetical protein